ncbi:MAG: class II glutamine amidotransferase [Desulfuromonadaceae bacterium]
MCRVLGITQFDMERHGPMITRFCQLARSGKVMAEDPPGHEDGWGLAFYEQGRLVVHKSGVNLLQETERVFGLLRELGSSPLLILHLRKSAWANTSNTRHAHPFYRDNTVFFHNGVVYDYQNLLPDIDLPELPADARDTEVFFYHILSRKGADLGEQFRASAAIIKSRYRYSALNSLFSDGQKLFVYRDYAREGDYYSLYRAGAANSRYFSSEPLDDALQWQMMAQEEFLTIELEET